MRYAGGRRDHRSVQPRTHACRAVTIVVQSATGRIAATSDRWNAALDRRTLPHAPNFAMHGAEHERTCLYLPKVIEATEMQEAVFAASASLADFCRISNEVGVGSDSTR